MANLTEVITNEIIDQRERMESSGIKPANINIYISFDSYNNNRMTIEYNMGSSYDGDNVKGSNLERVVTEYMRRKGWNEVNKPMVLIGSSEPDEDPQPDEDHGTVVLMTPPPKD